MAGGTRRISVLEFRLDHASWDEKRRELNVVYEANLDGARKRACEIMQFGAAGRQMRAKPSMALLSETTGTHRDWTNRRHET